MDSVKKPRIAFLCSGEGTTFYYLAKKPSLHPVCLITNSKKSSALKKAESLKIPSFIFSLKDYYAFDLWDEALAKCLKKQNADLVVLAGFLVAVGPQVLKTFEHRVLNSHPALLPHYGGKGMYGIHVHRSVCLSKEKFTGVTIHYVNKEYDKGQIIAQKKIEVLSKDTPESLQDRVKEVEKSFYAEVIDQLWKNMTA